MLDLHVMRGGWGFAGLGFVTRLSGHIKVISWALLALEVLCHFVFGWDVARRGNCVVLRG